MFSLHYLLGNINAPAILDISSASTHLLPVRWSEGAFQWEDTGPRTSLRFQQSFDLLAISLPTSSSVYAYRPLLPSTILTHYYTEVTPNGLSNLLITYIYSSILSNLEARASTRRTSWHSHPITSYISLLWHELVVVVIIHLVSRWVRLPEEKSFLRQYTVALNSGVQLPAHGSVDMGWDAGNVSGLGWVLHFSRTQEDQGFGYLRISHIKSLYLLWSLW
jgi:hypothetical protein